MKKALIISGGLLLGGFVALSVHLARKTGQNPVKKLTRAQIQSLEFDNGILSLQSLIKILDLLAKNIPKTIQAIKKEFQDERLRYHKVDNRRYRDVIQVYLNRQEQAIKSLTDEALNSFGVTPQDFDKSMSKYYSNWEVAERMTRLHPSEDMIEYLEVNFPTDLTEEKYAEILHFYNENLDHFADQHVGNCISPFERIVTELEIYDNIYQTYKFNEFQLATARNLYKDSARIQSLLENLKSIHKKLMPPIKVKA